MKLYAICFDGSDNPDREDLRWRIALPSAQDGGPGGFPDVPEQAFFWDKGDGVKALEAHLNEARGIGPVVVWEEWPTPSVYTFDGLAWSVQEYDVPAPPHFSRLVDRMTDRQRERWLDGDLASHPGDGVERNDVKD